MQDTNPREKSPFTEELLYLRESAELTYQKALERLGVASVNGALAKALAEDRLKEYAAEEADRLLTAGAYNSSESIIIPVSPAMLLAGHYRHIITPIISQTAELLEDIEDIRTSNDLVTKRIKALETLLSDKRIQVENDEIFKDVEAKIQQLSNTLAQINSLDENSEIPEIIEHRNAGKLMENALDQIQFGYLRSYGAGVYIPLAFLILFVDFFANYKVLELIIGAREVYVLGTSSFISGSFLLACHFAGINLKRSVHGQNRVFPPQHVDGPNAGIEHDNPATTYTEA